MNSITSLSLNKIARNALERQGVKRKLEIFDCIIEKGYTYLGEGRHRICFLSPNGKWVVKLARNFEGEIANSYEIDAWRDKSSRDRLARCKALNSEILVMEYVSTVPYDNLPEWAEYIDCCQVGMNRNGNIVVYDYGR